MKQPHSEPHPEGAYVWQIRLQVTYHLDSWVADQLGGLDVRHLEDGTTFFSGTLPDMPAVIGLILRFRDLALDVVALHVERLPEGQ